MANKDLPTAGDTTRRRSSSRLMETVLMASTACLLAAVAWPLATGYRDSERPTAQEVTTIEQAPQTDLSQATPAIQIALLLDTSSSMDGLIDQARSELWSVVNALDGARLHTQAAQLEIAVYEYGNSTNDPNKGWVRRVTPFSRDLDVVSEGLFSLTANGGNEFAGEAIGRAIDELHWREGDNVLRMLYIAGNESFGQGPVDYRSALTKAGREHVAVNLINCTMSQRTDPLWNEAAQLTGHELLTINHNAVAQYIAAPQDQEITELGQALNATYLGFGDDGRRGMMNQVAQDNNSRASGASSTVQRALSKRSGLYYNPSWDLVDKMKQDPQLGTVTSQALPPQLRKLDRDELRARVTKMANQRERIKKRLSKLQRERDEHLSTRERDGQTRLDQAIIASVVMRAKAAGFTLRSHDSARH